MSELGPELVTNGGFDTETDWTISNIEAWRYDSGYAEPVFDGVSGTIYQTIEITQGKTYRVTFDITEYLVNGGSELKGDLGGTEFAITENGSYSYDIVCGTSDLNITFESVKDVLDPFCKLDNVSVKEMSVADKIEESVFDLLRFDSTVSGLVSSRIYPQIIPQNTSFPALQYEVISAPRGHHFTGMTDLVPARFQITIWAKTYAELRPISDAVRSAIDSIQTTVGSVEIASCLMLDEVDLVETVPGTDQLRRYGRALDFRITYREN